MWEYSEKVRELYKNPKNVGSIENADAIGEAGSLTCGDALKIYLKIDDGVITDAKFQTFGCGSAVASSSILTELVKGKTVEEAKKITNKQIVEALGGLPNEKMHCSVMGYEALEDALKGFTTKEDEEKSAEKIICHCFGVSEKAIIEAIKKDNLKSVEQITEATYAGGACGRCREDLLRILNEVNPPKKETVVLNPVQFILKVNKVLDNVIATELAKDQGGIELIDVRDKNVYVKLTGTCKSCPLSQQTLKDFVEAQLRELADPEINVVEVNE